MILKVKWGRGKENFKGRKQNNFRLQDFRTNKLEQFHGFTKKSFRLIKCDWSMKASHLTKLQPEVH